MLIRGLLSLCLLVWTATVFAASSFEVVDVPTRPGVTVRMLVLYPDKPRAIAVLFSGGNGGLKMESNGRMAGGNGVTPMDAATPDARRAGNFLVRTRRLFRDEGLIVAVVDAPSDRQTQPFVEGGFRMSPEHVTDIRAVMAWLRQRAALPLWLVGTSRGTVSAAHVAVQTAGEKGGPDGIVLTSTILFDRRDSAVTDMKLDELKIPVLVVHHTEDGCWACKPDLLPGLMSHLGGSPRKELIMFSGGVTDGDPCEALSHHGYNGIEFEVVKRMAGWMLGS